MNQSLKRNLGFTLLEVLIAMAILAGTMIVVSSSWSGKFCARPKGQPIQHRLHAIGEQMSEIITKYDGLPLQQIPEKDGGDFGADFKLYRWEFESQQFNMPDMTPLIVKQAGPLGANEMLLTMIKTMQEFIKQSVREGKVTVFVKAKEKEYSFAVSTYFVDWTRDLPLGGL